MAQPREHSKARDRPSAVFAKLWFRRSFDGVNISEIKEERMIPCSLSSRAALEALVAAAALALSAAASAQSASAERASPQGDTWASIAELPDWQGLWEPTFSPGLNNERPMLTPPYAAKLEQYRADRASGEIEDTPSANCVPPGLPGVMTQPYPIEFLFTPGKVTVLIEAYSQWRQIFTDGRPHPENPDPTFNGHSIGHWEGDTLVVDSVGFSRQIPMGGQYGLEHSDQMRIVERMRKNDDDRLEIETTIYDPVALQKPWTTKRVYGHHPDWTLAEYICQENNRNYTTAEGKAGIDLDYEDQR
jgi:hypothetical protein